MSIFNWFNKIFCIDSPKTNNNLPPEFQLPTENIENRMHNFEFMQDGSNPFEESINVFHLSLDNFFRQLDLEFSSNEDSNIFTEYGIFDQSSNTEEYNNSIPKKNFMARNYFLKPSEAPRILSEHPVNVTMSPGLNFGQSSNISYITGNWNGKMVEKEISTRKLQDGSTEKVIVMKDGNQKCITTITENAKTREQNCTKQLINLDESELEEFESRFSKFKW